MIIYLKELGKDIIVGDSPGGIVSAESVWKATGLGYVPNIKSILLISAKEVS